MRGGEPMSKPYLRLCSPILAAALAIAGCLAPAHAGGSEAQDWQQYADDVSRQALDEANRAQQEAQSQLQDLKELHSLDVASVASLAMMEATAGMAAAHKHRQPGIDSSDANDSGGAGGTPVNERRPLNADGQVYVNDVSGSVVVTAWNRNEVGVTGELGLGVDHLEITGDPSSLSVVVKLPKHSHSSGQADLRLLVPSNARVTVETVSADVSLQGSRGAIKVNTVSGDVGLVSDAAEVDAQSVSGDLILQGSAKSTHAKTVSGDLRLTGLQGELVAETVSGNLELRGDRFSSLRLKSISGDLNLDVSFASQALVTGETLSGNITLRVPSDVSGTALLKSFSGETQCDMQPANYSSDSGKHSGKKREYVFGDGKGVSLQLSTFSGDIRVERGQATPAVPRPPVAPVPPAAPAAPVPPGR